MIAGLDANITCYALDEAYPEHEKLKDLLLNLSSDNKIAVNPTTIHETYHTLVFSQKWLEEDAADALKILLRNPYVEFFNQTKFNTNVALKLAVQHKLGGRDALIAANFLSNQISIMYTHDKELLKLQKITWKNKSLTFKDPLNQK
jgi:predicted nucleic acid-binding protein